SSAQTMLQIEIEGRRGICRQIRHAHDRCAVPGLEDQTGLAALAFQNRQDRMCSRLLRDLDADVETLCDGDRETSPRNRLDPEAVHGDQFAIQSSKVQVIRAHGRAVDDAQQDRPAWLDGYYLWVCQGAVIGEEGVVLHIVQVGTRSGAGRGVHWSRLCC